MKKLLTLAAILPASAAQAHWGHLGELAGHGHWVAGGAAAGAAILLGALLKKRAPEDAESAEEAQDAEEPQEA